MAITLSLAQTTQSADLTTLTFTDNTGTGVTGWGNGVNPAVTDIDAIGELILTIIISTPAYPIGVTYTCDLYTVLGSVPQTVADLVFIVNPSDLLDDNNEPLGSQTDPFPDGWYDIAYTITDRGDGNPDTYNTAFLLDGNIYALIVDHLINVPETYTYLDKFLNNYGSDEIIDTLYETALFESIEANVANANKDEIIEVLDTLQNITAEE